MCVSTPDIPDPVIPDAPPPLKETATTIERDTGTKKEAANPASRKSASDLRVDLSIPGVTSGAGLQV